MRDTPRTDAARMPINSHNYKHDVVHIDTCIELERENIALTKDVCDLVSKNEALIAENAALRELLLMAKKYVHPLAVTDEWKVKPVADCRLIDKIESFIGSAQKKDKS